MTDFLLKNEGVEGLFVLGRASVQKNLSKSEKPLARNILDPCIIHVFTSIITSPCSDSACSTAD